MKETKVGMQASMTETGVIDNDEATLQRIQRVPFRYTFTGAPAAESRALAVTIRLISVFVSRTSPRYLPVVSEHREHDGKSVPAVAGD